MYYIRLSSLVFWCFCFNAQFAKTHKNGLQHQIFLLGILFSWVLCTHTPTKKCTRLNKTVHSKTSAGVQRKSCAQNFGI